MRSLDPNLPINELWTMDTVVKENISIDRFISVISTAFAMLATFLAAIGCTACSRIRSRSARKSLDFGWR
jgi:hypothetical protein